MLKSAEVYFVPLPPQSSCAEQVEALKALLAKIDPSPIFAPSDMVAVKLHVGELHNDSHVKPALIKEIVAWLKTSEALPFLTETATLYKGERSDAVRHLLHAFRHGFTAEAVGAPFIMADGLLGNTELEVAIPGLIYQSVFIAREAVLADGLVAVSHPTGHIQTGLGACLKNLGMGLASRLGKLRQHSTINPTVKADVCTFCRACLKWCPEDAIIERDGRAFIIEANCTGCGECLAVCKFDAIAYNFETESVELQKRVAEHALGAIANKRNKSLFINVLAEMSKDCDCFATSQPRIMSDVGILLARDPVAIDQATLDLTAASNADQRDLGRKSYPTLDPSVQLAHAELIGLGTREYKLIKVTSKGPLTP